MTEAKRLSSIGIIDLLMTLIRLKAAGFSQHAAVLNRFLPPPPPSETFFFFSRSSLKCHLGKYDLVSERTDEASVQGLGPGCGAGGGGGRCHRRLPEGSV